MSTDVADNDAAPDYKRIFAFNLLLCPGDYFTAANRTLPTNPSYAAWIAQNWAFDEYVMLQKKALLEEHGPAFFLPDKYDIAHKLLKIADGLLTPSDERIKAIKLYADLFGMIDKPGTVIDARTQIHNVTNRVMIIKDHGNLDSWEAKAIEQQRALTTDAAADA